MGKVRRPPGGQARRRPRPPKGPATRRPCGRAGGDVADEEAAPLVVIRSPNIWDTPDVYELENLAADRAGVIDAAIDAAPPLGGADVLDLGCGTGFHLPRLAARGARVVGVEPHLPLVARARRRLAALGRAGAVLAGDAEALPAAGQQRRRRARPVGVLLRCRVRAGAGRGRARPAPRRHACIVDNDATRSTFGAWFSAPTRHTTPLRCNASGTARGSPPSA